LRKQQLVFATTNHSEKAGADAQPDGHSPAHAAGGRSSVAVAQDELSVSLSRNGSFSNQTYVSSASYTTNGSHPPDTSNHSDFAHNTSSHSVGSLARSLSHSHPHAHAHTLFPIAAEDRFSENVNSGRRSASSPKNGSTATNAILETDEFDMMDLFEDNGGGFRLSLGGNPTTAPAPTEVSRQQVPANSVNPSGGRSQSVGSIGAGTGEFMRSGAIGVNGITAARPKKRKSLTGSVTPTITQQQLELQHHLDLQRRRSNQQSHYGSSASLASSPVGGAMSLRSVSMVRRSITGNSNSSSPPGSPPVSGAGLALSI
jgi:hypothetical protein